MATGGALIGALRVTLGLDSAQFEAGSKRARQTAKSDVSAIQREFDRLKTIGSTLAGIWASSEIIGAAKRALDYASSLGEVAQQLGVTTRDLQLFRHIADQTGISQEAMDKSLAKLTRTIGEAAVGSKAQATAFRELGVSVQDGVTKRVLTAGEVLPRLADAFQKIKDPAARAAQEVKIFGKSGQDLDTLLAGGSAGLREMTRAFNEFGMELTPEMIAQADEAADKMAQLKRVLETKLAAGVASNADWIALLADKLGDLAMAAGKAYENFSNFRNLRGFNLSGSEQAAGNLLSTGSGRQVLKRDIQNRMDANMRARASGQGDPSALDAEFKNLQRARNGVLRAERAAAKIEAARAKPTSTPGALPTVAGSTKKAPKSSGPTAAEIEAKSQQELSRLRQEQIQAELSLTNDAEKRADLQSQLLLEEFNERSAQITNDEHFTVAQKEAQQAALKALYGVSGEGDKIIVGGNKNSLSAGIMRGLNEQLARQAYDAQAADLNAKKDALQGQLSLARTADDRRKIELEILDLEYQLRAAKLDQVINSQESSQAEKDLAQMTKDRLGSQRALDTTNVERQNMGPLATYMDSLPKTAGEVNEAFEQIAANGLANMNDQLANAAANTLKLKGLAGQLFNQLIADVIRLNLQQATGGGGGLLGGLVKIGTSIFGGGLGGVSASSLSALDGQASAIQARNLTGLAMGGTIGGFPGVDKNVLSINGIPTARVSANERIRVEPNSANDNGRTNIHVSVEEGALFRPVVTQISTGVAAPMSAQAASGGSIGAQKAIARSNSRRLA